MRHDDVGKTGSGQPNRVSVREVREREGGVLRTAVDEALVKECLEDPPDRLHVCGLHSTAERSTA